MGDSWQKREAVDLEEEEEREAMAEEGKKEGQGKGEKRGKRRIDFNGDRVDYPGVL